MIPMFADVSGASAILDHDVTGHACGRRVSRRRVWISRDSETRLVRLPTALP
jgi:hypothetical protein